MSEFLEALHFALAQPTILIIFSALVGLIFGGFATVAGDRLGQLAAAEDEGRELEEEMGLWWPASRCEGCGRSLNAIERMPGFGWFAVRGQCSSCGFNAKRAYLLFSLQLAGVGLLFKLAEFPLQCPGPLLRF